MKLLVAVLLLVSLAGNAALVLRPLAAPGNATTGVPHADSTTSSLEDGAEPRSRAGARSTAHETSAASITWDGLPVGDLEALAMRLREQGYPPHIVRGIVGHYLNEEYEAKRQALRGNADITPYWKQSVYASSGNIGQRAELRTLSREQAKRLGDLTGTATTMVDEPQLLSLRQRYGNLSADVLEEVMAIEQDYSELTREIRDAGQGLMFASDRQKIALLEEEKRKDLQSILSPEQYEELQLRSSATSQRLRASLVVMEPTEQEFRTIHNLQKAFDDRYANVNFNRNDPASRAEQRIAEQALVAAVKAELGDERGAAYEKSRDGQYVHAHTVAKQLSLAPDAGDRLYALQKETLQEFNRISSAPGMNTEQRQAAQRMFVKEKAAAIAAIVGEDNLPLYRNGMGGWLNMIEQLANRGTASGTTTTRIIAAPSISVSSP